jgi:hypothetical protein
LQTIDTILNDRDNYIIIRLDKTVKLSVGDEDLRVLDQDVGPSVFAIWSDSKQGIVAFAFDKGVWSGAEASGWVTKAKEAGNEVKAAMDGEGESMPYSSMDDVNAAIKGIKPPVTLAQANIIAGWADAIGKQDNPPDSPWGVAIAQFKKTYEVQDGKWVKKAGDSDDGISATSFDDIREKVRNALEKILVAPSIPNPIDMPPIEATTAYPWIRDIGSDQVVFEFDGRTFAASYIIQGNAITIGEPIEVKSTWSAQNGAIINLANSPLYAFWGSLGDGTDAEEKGDGLIWKEILHPGTWFKSNSGKSIAVTSHIIKEAFRAFTDGYPRYVSVPADHHWLRNSGIVPAETNRGFVKKLKLVGNNLFAGFSFTNEDVKQGVLEGSIADVSAYLRPDVTHNATGEHYDWALLHVLLTNNPLVPDLRQWGEIAAGDMEDDIGGQVFNYVQKGETIMSETPDEDVGGTEDTDIMLTGQAATEYSYLRERGYTSTQLMGLAEQSSQLEALGLSVEGLVAQAVSIRQKSRELEISRVIAAMEGSSDHAGVVSIPGYRHHPVVVEAVSNALGNSVRDLALSSDDEGQTSVDALLLEIINAIPEGGRLPISAGEAGGRHDGGQHDGDDEELSDEQIDEFIEEIK